MELLAREPVLKRWVALMAQEAEDQAFSMGNNFQEDATELKAKLSYAVGKREVFTAFDQAFTNAESYKAQPET